MPAQDVSAKPGGVVIIGGAHGTIALARDLKPLGVPVWFLTDDNILPRFSRHMHRTLDWPGPNDPAAARLLLDIAAGHGLTGYVLVASGDAEVELVSREYDLLAGSFVLTVPRWERLEWACEKARAYSRAIDLGLGIPLIHNVSSAVEAAQLKPQFPVVLKPSSRVERNPFTMAKAWKIESADEFLPAYERAAGYVGAANVVVQEMVPGGGECQFSYAALWNEGTPVAEFAARRTRQFPVEFGFTSTFVEVVDQPDVIEAGRRFAGSIPHHGLIEVEFKRDPRSGQLKLLDINPRPWSWFALAEAGGVPLGKMLWAMACGETPPTAQKPKTGAAWMYLPRDVVPAGVRISQGRLRLGDYLKSFGRVRAWATFAWDDPLPALLDVPIALFRVLTKRLMARLKPKA